MSVGGSTVESVISPGVMTQVPSECEGAPPARGPRPGLNGRTVNGSAPGRARLDGVELDGVELGDVELGRLEFAVVDLETTGWSPGAAAITEIGAVRVRGAGPAGGGSRRGEFVRRGEFASLVNPGMPVPAG